MKTSEKAIESSLLICALSSVLVIALIIIFIITSGTPVIVQEGLVEFITGAKWDPYYDIYGIFPMIVGTLAVTALSLVLALPLGLGCAVLMAEVAPASIRDALRPVIDTLAAIPSIVYGLFGLFILVPYIRDDFSPWLQNVFLSVPLNGFFGLAPAVWDAFIMPPGTSFDGFSTLACGVILAIMILPTIISVSEDSLRAVHRELREGSLALGATKWQMITGIVVPAGLSGIVTGVMLGMGRSIGETMAVLMISGNGKVFPALLSHTEPLTAVIALEMGYASGNHQTALFSVGIVLLVVIMVLNVIIYTANRRKLDSARV